MMNDKLVSVLIPAYNCDKFIEKSVMSVVRQSYKNIEIVIIDDCSSDNTYSQLKQIESKYPDIKFVIIKNEVNMGVSTTRNRLVAASNGDYIAFLDSDDYYDKDFLNLLVEKLESNNADLSQCLYYSENEDGSDLKVSNHYAPSETIDGKSSIIEMLNGKITGFLWNKLFKSSLFDSINFDDKKVIFEDYEVLLKIFNKNIRVAFSSAPLYHYVQRPQSLTKKSYDKATMRLDYLKLTDDLTSNALSTDNERKIFLRHKYSIIARVAYISVTNTVSLLHGWKALLICREQVQLSEFRLVLSLLTKKTKVLIFLLYTFPFSLLCLKFLKKI